MTTKAKRSVSLPHLPPEIWDYVFDYATHVPGTLVPEIYDQSGLIGPLYNQKYHPELRAALVTKRYLVRVCKQWWHLASPYLYRSVYIGRAHCLSSLCSTLMRSAVEQGTMKGRLPLGLWTQRIDVAIRDHGTDPPAEVAILADVISHMPNLVIASFPIKSSLFDESRMPAPVLNSLRRSAASLRVLEFSYRLEPLTDELSELLRVCSQLRILNCRGMVWSHRLELGATIPNVTTLRLRELQPPSFTSEITTQNTRIALKELVLVAINLADYWHDFMHQYGSRLTAIHLQCPLFPQSLLAMEYLQLVEETCPNVRRITVSLVRFTALHHNIRLPPIEYLGLRADKFLNSKSEFQRLFSVLAGLGAAKPSIRVVQLTSRHNVNCLLKSHWQVAVDALGRVLAGCTFRLEDDNGNLLEDRLKALGHM